MDITETIRQWGMSKGISDPAKQYMKVMEEMGELSEAFNKHKYPELVDSFGDVQVTLIILADLMGINYQDSLKQAYEVIKDRDGELIDGVFVKREDLD